MAAIKYWVWLSALRMRPRAKQLLLEHMHGDPEALYYAEEKALRAVEGIRAEDLVYLSQHETRTAEAIIDACRADDITMITVQDAQYPERLKNIYDPPMVLYVKGRLPNLDDEAAIAVAGTREASPYGLRYARKFGYGLAKCGAVIISGLTRGIDRTAAEGALMAEGTVVGVLGTGLDEAKGALYEDVLTRGALVSEYPPGGHYSKANFRFRNRITAGLSAGVLIVEAPEKSGALLLAGDALEQGKEIFTIPANADALSFRGNMNLLRDGAIMVYEPWQVLEDFSQMYGHVHWEDVSDAPEYVPAEQKKYADFVTVRSTPVKKVIDKPKSVTYIDWEQEKEHLSDLQKQIIELLQRGPAQIDDLIEVLDQPAPTILPELTLLEIEGLIHQTPGKQFVIHEN